MYLDGPSYNSQTLEKAARTKVTLETYYHNLVVMHNEREGRYNQIKFSFSC